MCAISGFYCYNEQRPSVEILKGLMLASQTRGKSAAGMAYMNNKNQIMIRKQEGPAEDLVTGMTDVDWAEVSRSPRALFHARATTKGSEKDNENNHPVSNYGWVVVHNGHITNDDELFAYYKEERYAAVDTAAIPLVLKQGKDYEDSLRHLSILAGQASMAVWSLSHPDKIAISRLGSNDVYLFFDPTTEIMYWCSTPLAGRSIPGFALGNMAFFTVAKLHENKLMILEPTKERARLLKFERRPFAPGRQYQHQATWAGHMPNSGKNILEARPAKTTTGLTGCNTKSGITKDAKSKMFEWGQANETWKDKPFVDISSISSEWFSWSLIVDYFRTEFTRHGATASVFTLLTAYGRWVFNCQNTAQFGVFDSMFFPARRVKKYWRRNFSEEIPRTKLPTILGILDEKMTLEEFVFIEVIKTSPPGNIRHMGHMCPWCGITMATHSWSQLEFRCPACGVKSRPYVREA